MQALKVLAIDPTAEDADWLGGEQSTNFVLKGGVHFNIIGGWEIKEEWESFQ